MKKSFVLILLLFLLSGVFLLSCSKENEQPTTGGKKMTDKAAEAIEKKVNTPKDKARATQTLGEERTDAIDKGVQDPGGR